MFHGFASIKCLHILSLSTVFDYVYITMCLHTKSLSTDNQFNLRSSAFTHGPSARASI